MLRTLRKSALALAALGAFGLGGAAVSSAVDNGTSTSGTADASTSGASSSHPHPHPARQHREPLSDSVAAKVKAAALKKVPGATVLRTEAGGPPGTAYHAHIRTSGGELQVVFVNASFEATAVEADRRHFHRRGHGPGCGGERP